MKPSIPKGTRDFSPEQVAKRTYIFNTIRKTFSRYGFQPIETPTMENLSTLTGKYGEEGDQLLFKILNSGDFLRGERDLSNYKKLTPQISEKGLRYDLTIPFARYVVMHQNEIALPFRRYQIQPVWRGDAPSHGRYREFYQCDADIIGSNSLLNEVELLQIYDEVFSNLGIKVSIKVNNRKILQGLAEIIGYPDKMMDITIAIDKFDKIGSEGVINELLMKGLSEEAANKVIKIIGGIYGNTTSSDNGTPFPYTLMLDRLKKMFYHSSIGLKGVEELEIVLDIIAKINKNSRDNTQNHLLIDLTLARGLNYYTGCIFEVKALDVKMGSIGGGGRYDDLTGVFGLKGISGVGISFGADRIYDVLEELNLFPISTAETTKIMLLCFDEEAQNYACIVAKTLRNAGINTEIYADLAKMKKQLEYANKRNIPFVAIIGSEEVKNEILTVKNMQTAEQEKLTVTEIIQKLK
jgi:histidyl-tRNA synthetase